MDYNIDKQNPLCLYDTRSHIISFSDLHTINSLMRTCKAIWQSYQKYTVTVTKDTIRNYYFGIDKVLDEHPHVCKSLRMPSMINILINYAHNNEKIFNKLQENLSDTQRKTQDDLMRYFVPFNPYWSKKVLSIYKGECCIGESDNKQELLLALDIYIKNLQKSRKIKMSVADLFCIAEEHGLIKHMELLFSAPFQGGTIEASDSSKNNIFRTSILKNNKEALQLCLKYRSWRINDRDYYGFTPFHCAIRHNNKEILLMLLGCKDIDVNKPCGGTTPLVFAINCNIEIALLLLNHKAIDVDLPNKGENQPLMRAVTRGCLKVVKLLLERGANINKFLLFSAVRCHRNIDIASLLLEREDADIDRVDYDERTLLHYAVDNYFMTELVLNKCGNRHIYKRDRWERTPFDCALEMGNKDVIKLLRSHYSYSACFYSYACYYKSYVIGFFLLCMLARAVKYTYDGWLIAFIAVLLR